MRVICIGDSIAYGQNVRADEAWPAVLARETGWDVRNAGVCGDTSRLGLERFPKHVQLHKPDLVVIQFGHNDANCWETDNGLPRVGITGYRANMREMVDRARHFGARTIVLQPHHAPGLSNEYNRRLGLYRRALAGWSIEPPVGSFVDDGYGQLHPDAAMHERYARTVLATMEAGARAA